jgi:hypothetical protein
VKNHKAANNLATADNGEKINKHLESLEF